MPPVKPCSSRSRSKIRFDVCCCFFGRDLSSRRIPSITGINGSSFGFVGAFLRTYPGGTENFIILFTVRGSSPNRRAAARSLRPSIRTAWRTRPYSSTPFIPALCQSNAKGYLLPDFYSGGATGISGRFSEGLLLRRFHAHELCLRQPG